MTVTGPSFRAGSSAVAENPVNRDPVKLLLHGFDTVQCCYFLAPRVGGGIDTVQLAAERERLRLGGPEESSPVTLGNRQFLLASHGSR